MEAIPDTLDGVDDLEPPRPQYLAKLGNPMIDGASGDSEFHPPDLFQEMIAAEGLSVVDHEVFQQGKGFRGQLHRLPPRGDRFGQAVEFQPAAPDARGVGESPTQLAPS